MRGLGFRFYDVLFMIQGSWLIVHFRVPGFWFRVSGYKSMVHDLWCKEEENFTSSTRFRIASFEVRVSCPSFRVSGFRFRVSNFGFRFQASGFDFNSQVPVFGFRGYRRSVRWPVSLFEGLGFGFRVSGLGFRVSGLESRISGV